jgi:hypothetical protein
MDLAPEHLDLLRTIDALEESGRIPGTKAVGERLLETWQQRGGPYSWHATAPWHGTTPWALELREEGLVDVHVGMAQPHRWDEPSKSADQYGLALTDAGRQALADHG